MLFFLSTATVELYLSYSTQLKKEHTHDKTLSIFVHRSNPHG